MYQQEQNNDEINREDELRAENEVLKLKLELEHGMKDMGADAYLDANTQYQWLNYIYNFEQLHKNAKKISVYDAIGRPAFIKANELSVERITQELDRLFSIMHEKGVALDMLAEYEDEVIYRFITEELFAHEMDEVRIEGMVHHFTYEDFHVNHDYDLRQYAEEFMSTLTREKWNEKFHSLMLYKTVRYKGVNYDEKNVSPILQSFWEGFRPFRLDQVKIDEVSIDMENGRSVVEITVIFSDDRNTNQTGRCTLHFIFDYGYWYIREFTLPYIGSVR
jgi:hypothetical protein